MNENKPLKIGYARVSTEDQELALQLQALEREGCDKVFTEKVSGSANSKQNQLEIALMNVRRGDTFIVWKLDRLGRDVVQLNKLISNLDERGVQFKSLMDLVDITTARGKFVFQIAAALAEMESNVTSERTKAGIQARRAAGFTVGARMYRDRIDDKKRARIEEDIQNPLLSKNAICTKYGMAQQTLRRNWESELAAAGKLGK